MAQEISSDPRSPKSRLKRTKSFHEPQIIITVKANEAREAVNKQNSQYSETMASDSIQDCEPFEVAQPSTPSNVTSTTTILSPKSKAVCNIKESTDDPKAKDSKPPQAPNQKKCSTGFGRSQISGTLGSLMGRINSLDNKLEELRIPQPDIISNPKSRASLPAAQAEGNEATAIYQSLVSRIMPTPESKKLSKDPLLCNSFQAPGCRKSTETTHPQIPQSSPGDAQQTTDLLLKLVSHLQQHNSQADSSQCTSGSGELSERSSDLEVESPMKRMRIMRSLSSSPQNQVISIDPTCSLFATNVLEHQHASAAHEASGPNQGSVISQKQLSYGHGQDPAMISEKILASLEKASSRNQKGPQDHGAAANPQSQPDFSLDGDKPHLRSEDMQEIVQSYLAQISGCLKKNRNAKVLPCDDGQTESQNNGFPSNSRQSLAKSSMTLAKQRAIMHPMGDDIESPAKSNVHLLPSAEDAERTLDMDFIDEWASDLNLDEIDALNFDSML